MNGEALKDNPNSGNAISAFATKRFLAYSAKAVEGLPEFVKLHGEGAEPFEEIFGYSTPDETYISATGQTPFLRHRQTRTFRIKTESDDTASVSSTNTQEAFLKIDGKYQKWDISENSPAGLVVASRLAFALGSICMVIKPEIENEAF